MTMPPNRAALDSAHQTWQGRRPMTTSWIVSAARTPIGRYLGELSHFSAPQLGGLAIAGCLQRLQSPGAPLDGTRIDEVIFGQVVSAGVGQAPARQAALAGGIPDSVGCATVNKVCGSGLYAAMLADRAIRAGDAQVVVAGGMESMSQAPHLLRRGRSGWKYGPQPLLDAVELDGLTCAYGQVAMGEYAEQVAREHGITREAQDAWSLQSHQRAIAAAQSGALASEIVPVPDSRGDLISIDGSPRADSSLERLAKLKPAFRPDGSVTAGNASSLSDGAAAVLLASESCLSQFAGRPAYRIVGTAIHAAPPRDLFIAPVGAIEQLLRKTGHTVGDVDLFEINEAFASQTLACRQALNIDPGRLNIHGGAIALGHPIGAARPRAGDADACPRAASERLGVAALCLGGGEAVAMMIEVQSLG